MSYLFIDFETGDQVELDLDFDFLMENQKNGIIEYEGRLLKRDISGELKRDNNLRIGSSRIEKLGPLKRISSAGGVNPDQVQDAREHYATVHPGISFHDNGDVEFSSRGARKAFLKAAGLNDRNGGYGD